MLEIEEQTAKQMQEHKKTLSDSLFLGCLSKEQKKTVTKMFKNKEPVSGSEAGALNKVLQAWKKEKTPEDSGEKILMLMKQKAE